MAIAAFGISCFALGVSAASLYFTWAMHRAHRLLCGRLPCRNLAIGPVGPQPRAGPGTPPARDAGAFTFP